MADERPVVGFFSAFFGVCRGTLIFGRLVQQSVWRTLLHLLMLTLILALWVASQNAGSFDDMMERPQRIFNERFGGLKLDDRGLVPVKTVKSPVKMEINKDLQLVYCEKSEDFEEDLLQQNAPGSTLMWFPTALGVAIRESAGLDRKANYKVWIACFGDESSFEIKQIPGNELRAFWNKEVPATFEVDSETEAALAQISTDRVFYSMKMLYLGGLFLGMAMEILFYALFLSLFSALVLSATSMRRELFGYAQLFKLGVYAGFPAMMIGSLFPAWQLPYMQYPMVYAFGTVIYCSVALRSMEREKVSQHFEKEE